MDLYNISFDMEDWYDISIENDTDGLEPYLSTTFLVTSCIVSSIGLPLTLLAIYALYSLVQENNVAPVYVINLLISDLIQMCCLVIWVENPRIIMFVVSAIIYSIGLMASVGFMVCVAMERYLVIACPLWYRFRRNINITGVVCFTVWVLPLLVAFLNYYIFISYFSSPHILLSIYLLVPFPLLIFFLAGTVKALSSSISVPPEEKRRIVGTLVLVLLNYTLLFLPTIILYISADTRTDTYNPVQSTLLQLSPLMDLVLYIFMKKGAVDKLLGYLCRCRMTTEQEQG
ncbi:LOW QUALITY PROTEIN: G-protein coupled receptor 4-like [Myripristis murdjan]|uniref:LOW QUALITY PROTEIN: G-protein coupled receptor 4-like n=1 Tax=Myripristis murdjan TaxID=586833 RepID=UPI001175DE9B|nr:LOW QUALITY PROTEIN: G-protein coupled receptor 4-like [Myripristis murdjan]